MLSTLIRFYLHIWDKVKMFFPYVRKTYIIFMDSVEKPLSNQSCSHFLSLLSAFQNRTISSSDRQTRSHLNRVLIRVRSSSFYEAFHDFHAELKSALSSINKS